MKRGKGIKDRGQKRINEDCEANRDHLHFIITTTRMTTFEIAKIKENMFLKLRF